MQQFESNSNDGSSVAYIYSRKLVEESNKIGQINNRANLVNSLIHAYDLFKHLKYSLTLPVLVVSSSTTTLRIVNPFVANDKLLNLYHSNMYIEAIKKISENQILNESADEHGLGYDCPIIENMYEFCCTIAGASLTAAQLINCEKFKYVINWFGGWHHAKREKANGYCYVNDIALCILKLREKYNKILYIDLDLHHGDGVQDAFEFTDKVMTLSFHKYTPGFYPGTGSIDEIGKGKGKYYTINVPLQSGVTDDMYIYMFTKIMKEIQERFKPEVIVCQCGADSLFGDSCDPQNPFNLTINGYTQCIKTVLELDSPTVFLGGGGYNFALTSRLWCNITSMLTNVQLENDIPEHENFLEYGPDYELLTDASKTIKNKNTDEYIDRILSQILSNLKMIN